jgi:endonuclease/exonuclease/phosphatase family metal-dependent hydrolase
MKILSLNTWGGRAGREKLLEFIDAHRDVDIFCLQEIWSAPHEHLEGAEVAGWKIDHSQIMTHGLEDMSRLLNSHTAYFHPCFGDNYGQLLLIKKEIPVSFVGERFIYQEKGYVSDTELADHARLMQYAVFEHHGRKMSVLNIHGLWNGQGKGDSEHRIEQSKNILNQIDELEADTILCGDLNLRPDTKSIGLLEHAGLRNLVVEYGVTSTRTSHYSKDEPYADYIFTSQGLSVIDFRVLPDEVSDHKALLVEIE